MCIIMVYIYVLALENNKYYVGKTCSPIVRIHNHFNNKGSAYTRTHKPVEIKEIRSDCDDFDEDKTTLEYMCKHGIDNVRGGSFTQLEFDDTTRHFIQRMINGADNRCFYCGSNDHFINKCDEHKQQTNKRTHTITSSIDEGHIIRKIMLCNGLLMACMLLANMLFRHIEDMC